ncbi:CPBP family intramembrane glutamic endopeptidase [Atopobium fossor]|uniref:CPBP family intramembrane glutamic endopeptidase n=1 Tax=Atopobium fossor TaxID=39487 RepID=UPI000414CF89|nr:type II CAAX endopeptidase family protein [Atopobium fossor]
MTYFVKPHRRFMLSLCVLAFVLLQVLSVGVAIVYAIGSYIVTLTDPDTNIVMLLVIGISALASVWALYLLGGKRAIAFHKEDLLYTLKHSKYLIVLACLQLLLSLTTIFSGEQAVISTWPIAMAQTFFICVFVGISEEATYRGIILGGLLARFGKTRRGFNGAILVAALIFGAAHITPGTELNAVNIAQLVLKVIQTGILGLFFSAFAIKRTSFWGSSLIHFLWDFILLSGAALVKQSVEISYTSSGEEGVAIAIYYLVIIVLQIPLIISSFRTFRSTSAPYCGWLSDVVTFDENGNESVVTTPQLVAAINNNEQSAEAVLASMNPSAPQVSGIARSSMPVVSPNQKSVPAPPSGFYDLSGLEDPVPSTTDTSLPSDVHIQQSDDRPPRPMGL